MENLQSNDILNDTLEIDNVDTVEKANSNIENNSIDEDSLDSQNSENPSTDIIEYKEIDKPCVSLTIIGENRLSNAEIFVKRSFKFSIKSFFSTLVLTIMNMFI